MPAKWYQLYLPLIAAIVICGVAIITAYDLWSYVLGFIGCILVIAVIMAVAFNSNRLRRENNNSFR